MPELVPVFCQVLAHQAALWPPVRPLRAHLDELLVPAQVDLVLLLVLGGQDAALVEFEL
jgi:hypothetical protein